MISISWSNSWSHVRSIKVQQGKYVPNLKHSLLRNVDYDKWASKQSSVKRAAKNKLTPANERTDELGRIEIETYLVKQQQVQNRSYDCSGPCNLLFSIVRWA